MLVVLTNKNNQGGDRLFRVGHTAYSRFHQPNRGICRLATKTLAGTRKGDGFTSTTLKLRSFKSYLVGNNVALVSSDAIDVVRVRYGGYDHRQTPEDGTQISLAVDPPGHYGL